MTEQQGRRDSALGHGKTQRVHFLDGLRGLAILLVIGYHYFSRFAENKSGLYPYGSSYADVWLFQYGFYGVYLFFAISGFVIALSLERCDSYWEFAVKRFARLWPTMLLCAVISFCILSIWPAYWPQRWSNFLPSLTFVDGQVWNRLIPGLQSSWIDGAYWSLFVEVRFYFWAALLWFVSGRKRFQLAISAMSLVAVLLHAVLLDLGQLYWAELVSPVLIAKYWPWFLVGIAALNLMRKRTRSALWLAGLAGLQVVLLLWSGMPKTDAIAFCVVAALMLGVHGAPELRSLLESRWLVGVGVASYSLYLLHEYAGLTVIAEIAKALGCVGWSALPVMLAILALLVFLSRTIYEHWESPCNRVLLYVFLRPKMSPQGQHSAEKKMPLNDGGNAA